MRSLLVLGTTIALVTPVAADPPQCRRWKSNLTTCEALNTGSSTTCTYTPVGIENETVNGVLFSSSALTACKKLIKKMNPAAYHYTSAKTIRACKWSTTPSDKKCYDMPSGAFAFTQPTTAACVYDSNGDTKIDADDYSQLGYTVHLETPLPDDHCFCTVSNTPHAGLPWSGNMGVWESSQVVFGHSFPRDLKAAVLQHNFTTNNGSYISEAISTTSFDPEPVLQKVDIYADDAAEVDHIIPRVDSKGCLCGDPTTDNAAVISRRLNAQMLNVSPKYNQDRSRMYAKYVTCPSTSQWQYRRFSAIRIDTLDNAQLDESSLNVEVASDPPPGPTAQRATAEDLGDTETGGCSAGGLAGLGIALTALGLRRRRHAAGTV